MTSRPPLSTSPFSADPVRSVHIASRGERDPAEPWETPASPDELTELSTRRFERLPHRPANAGEIPDGAMDALRSVLGDLTLDQLFVIPRNARMVDASAGARWVVTPTEVLAVGADRIAVWIDDAGRSRIRALIPFSDVIAISDRTVLLYGRLELVGRDESVVVRYNTVGRPELRVLLEPLRATAGPPEAVPVGTGASPDSLPHKWMALTRSRDVQPSGPGPVVVAPGELDSTASILHSGVVILTGRELIVATDPTPDVQLPQYGFDLLVVGRSRVLGLEGDGAAVLVIADAAPGRVAIAVDAHPSVVAGAVQVVGPLVSASVHA